MSNVVKFPEPDRVYIGDDGTYMDMAAARRYFAKMTAAERAEFDAAAYQRWYDPLPLPETGVPDALWLESYRDWCKWFHEFMEYHGHERDPNQ